ncbi:Uncharacterised protein [Bordetella pertussis]|nr:Uncharacterised protein [Bordetella pertussis]CFP65185.1 Uncharacterised protein [Bordetella pertussis]
MIWPIFWSSPLGLRRDISTDWAAATPDMAAKAKAIRDFITRSLKRARRGSRTGKPAPCDPAARPPAIRNQR